MNTVDRSIVLSFWGLMVEGGGGVFTCSHCTALYSVFYVEKLNLGKPQLFNSEKTVLRHM